MSRTGSLFIAIGMAAALIATALVPTGAQTPLPSDAGSTSGLLRAAVAPCDVSWNACRGSLEAGTYGTRLFTPPFTYTVEDGWANVEDEDGNFLIIPPGASIAGVDAGRSDYLGVYASVRVPVRCSEVVDASVDATPEGIADWLARQGVLDLNEPVLVSVGGLSGVVIDVSLSPDNRGCGGSYPILVGTGRSSLTHAVSPSQPLRLYLLASEAGTLAIEAADATGGGSVYEDWYAAAQRIVDGLVFEDAELLATVTLAGDSCSVGPPADAAGGGRAALGVVNQTGDRAVFDLVGLRRSGSFEQLRVHIDAEREAALSGRPGLGFPNELVDLVASSGVMEAGVSATVIGFGYEEYGIVCLGYVQEAAEIRPHFVAGPIRVR